MCYLTSSIFCISLSILMLFSCSLLLFLPISDSRFVTFSLCRFPFSWNSMLCKCHRQIVHKSIVLTVSNCVAITVSQTLDLKQPAALWYINKAIVKTDYKPHHGHFSTQNNLTPNRQMFMKFHICGFYNCLTDFGQK